MAVYKVIVNPFTGQFQLVNDESMFHVKDSVATYTSLPVTGNSENDARFTKDTDKLYVWSIASSSGVLTDWIEVGSVSSVDWSAITNKPTSSVSDIDDTVSKRHTQGTDQGLDTGGINATTAADIKDAVTKKHDAATVGDGLSILGQQITNSDRGTIARNAHEAYFNHDNIINNLMLAFFKISILGSFTVYELINGFVDEFEDEAGIDLGSSVNQQYNSTDDYYEPAGTGSNLIPIMTSNTAPSGVASASSVYQSLPQYAAWKAMNHTNADESDCWVSHDDASSGSPQWLQYQFTSGQTINKYTITTRNRSSGISSPKDWKLQGSNNGSDWTDLDIQTGQFPTNPQNTKVEYTFTNTTSYTYYRLYITDNNEKTGVGVIVGELELISTTTLNMTLTSITHVASIAPTHGRIVLFEQDVDSVTLNTDLKAYMSRDDGTTWTQLTLSEEGTYEVGKRIVASVSIDISAQPSDTDVRMKIQSFNNKAFKLHGVALNWD